MSDESMSDCSCETEMMDSNGHDFVRINFQTKCRLYKTAQEILGG